MFSGDTTLFYELHTDSDGVAILQDRPQASLTIGASAPNYSYSQVTIGADQDNVSLTLQEGDPIGMWKVLRSAGEKLGGTNSAVLLPDGRIFYCHNTQDPILFDPLTNTIERAKKSQKIQGCAATCLLPDGTVIFVGGADQEVYGPGTKQVKTYNPLMDEWQILPQINDDRWYPTMVQFPGGMLLATGGGGLDNPKRINSSELMDPKTRQWIPTDTSVIGNEVSPVALLYTGEALMTHRPPQLYNPQTGKWRLAAPFVQSPRTPDGNHADHEITVLPDGRVTAIGYIQQYRPTIPGHNVEIYDPISDRWSLGADQPPVRSRCKSVLLPTKKILVAGGFKESGNDTSYVNQYGYMKRADLYDPYANSWTSAGQMNIAREYHATSLLIPDGRVIIAAGEGQPGNEPPDTSVIEAYYPSYFFKGIRPEIVTPLLAPFRRAESISFDVRYTTKLTSLLLMGTAAVTHFTNSGNARCIELQFEQNGSSVTALLPADSNIVPIGYYMLIPIVDDIAGIGTIVKIEGGQNQAGTSPANLQRKSVVLNVSPQPCGNELAVSLASDWIGVSRIEITDVYGRICSNELAQISKGENNLKVNTNQLASGMYSIVIETDKTRLVGKFIKL